MTKDSRDAIADYAPDALSSLRESFALHLDATRKPKTARIYLDALDNLIRHLEAHGMPLTARGLRREHIESYLAARKPKVAPSTLSLEYRAIQQFCRCLLEEDEIDRDPTERMRAPTVPEAPVPVVPPGDFKKLLKTAEGKDFTSRRDTAVLLTLYDTGMRAGELIGLRLPDVDLRRTRFLGRFRRRAQARLGIGLAVAWEAGDRATPATAAAMPTSWRGR